MSPKCVDLFVPNVSHQLTGNKIIKVVRNVLGARRIAERWWIGKGGVGGKREDIIFVP